MIYEPLTGQVLASAGLFAGMAATVPDTRTIAQASTGQVPVVSPPGSTVEQAVVQLDMTPPLMLMIEPAGRSGDSRHM